MSRVRKFSNWVSEKIGVTPEDSLAILLLKLLYMTPILIVLIAADYAVQLWEAYRRLFGEIPFLLRNARNR